MRDNDLLVSYIFSFPGINGYAHYGMSLDNENNFATASGVIVPSAHADFCCQLLYLFIREKVFLVEYPHGG